MMKRLILFLCTISCSNQLLAQNYVGTWINGDNTDISTVYGPAGVSSPSANPGSRGDYTHWTDANGVFWLYGGSSSHWNGLYADLWKYEPSVNQWTFVKGPQGVGASAVYGTMGVSAPQNSPGGRVDASSWMDKNGNLWLYGGYGRPVSTYGSLNDLWMYDVSKNEWTWINGSKFINQLPAHGTKNVPSSTNSPGSISSAANWVDANGDFWLYGGVKGSDAYSAMWKYSPGTNQWTWVQGSSLADTPETLGTMGVPDGNNTPGALYSAATWKDASNNLWLFAGTKYNYQILPYLWKYDIGTSVWTWMKGSMNDYYTFGLKGVSSGSNTPYRREELNACLDKDGNAIIYSGEYDYGDLWKYEFSSNNWVWIGGSDVSMMQVPAHFGTKGVASFKNNPGGRKKHRIWSSSAGDIYLFGGYSLFGDCYQPHDIWKFSHCPLPEEAILSANTATHICSGNSVTVTITNTTSFTFYDDNNTQLGTGNSFVTPVFNTPYSQWFDFYAQTTSTCAADAPRQTISILALALPNIFITESHPLYCTGTTQTLTAYGANTYTWNGSFTGNTFTVSPNHSTNYYVQGASTEGCVNSSSLAVVPNTVTAFNYTISNMVANFSISNPACTTFTWDFGNGSSSSINPNPVMTYANSGTYGVCLKCDGLPPECLRCFNIQVPSNAIGGVGINEYGNAEYIYELSPNPTDGKFRIESFRRGTLQIFTLSGARILNTELQEGEHEFDLSEQSAGTYLVRYISDGRVFNSRLVKQ